MTAPLQSFRRPFALGQRLGDLLIGRYLARRADALLAAGHPPIAIFAHDYIGRQISLQGRFEREELDILFAFLRPLGDRFARQVALDIGANVGNHSLYFAPHFAEVRSFEPNPRTFALLAANALLDPKIQVQQTALGDAAGTLPLRYNPANVGEASLMADGAGSGGHSVDVPVQRLDDLVDPAADVGFIKIDVEGFEEQVFRGAARVLAGRPVIAFEQNPAAFVNGRSAVADQLQALGYQLCLLGKRDVGGLGALISKLVHGVRYDVVPVDLLAPGHYPMILALGPDDLARLRAGGGQ
jgi:FkbM family methyltransferase